MDLRERSWYYLCIEWENFNRHNETTGTDCRIYRTLGIGNFYRKSFIIICTMISDRFGKGIDTTVNEIEATDVSSQMFMFRLRASVDFPIRCGLIFAYHFLEKKLFIFRISAFLQGGLQVAAPPAQVFIASETTDLDVVFPYLRQQKDYGRLCILEEPLVNGFTAMGRLVSGLSLQKCHFCKFR